MKLLLAVFLGMFLYGITVGLYGHALLSLLVAGLVVWADRRFVQQERLWAQSPSNAKSQNSTIVELDKQDCECTSSRF